MATCGMNLIYGYMLGIATFVVIWALKKLTIRKGIKEVIEEEKEKMMEQKEAEKKVLKAKNFEQKELI